MYKYLCVISDSADEKNFHDTIERIKEFYPHLEYAEQFVNGSLEKIIIIPNEKGEPSSICIRADFQNFKTVVMSEAYLHHIFYGREVENISKYKGMPVKLLLSAAFLIVNIFIIKQFSDLILIYLFAPWLVLVHLAPLAVIYGVSAWGIKKTAGLSPSQILFVELGGYLLIPFLAVIFIWGIITNSLNSIPIFFFGIRYVCLLLPFAAIGTAVAEKITKK